MLWDLLQNWSFLAAVAWNWPPQCSTEGKNEWIVTFTSPYVYVVLWLNKGTTFPLPFYSCCKLIQGLKSSQDIFICRTRNRTDRRCSKHGAQYTGSARVLTEKLNSSSACQKISHLLVKWKSSPLVRILSQANPLRTPWPDFYNIHFIIIPHLHLGLTSGCFPSGFPTKFCMHFYFSHA
jgi:hypothetical protein